MAAELRRRNKYADIRTMAKQALLYPLKLVVVLVAGWY